jgi:hypothetical protein
MPITIMPAHNSQKLAVYTPKLQIAAPSMPSKVPV